MAWFLNVGVAGAVLCTEVIGRFGMGASERELEAREFAVRTVVLVEFLERVLLEEDAAVFVTSAGDFEGDLWSGLEGGCTWFGGSGLGGC